MAKKRRPYKSLQDWMERTGTNQSVLAKRTGIHQSHISRILMKSVPCSLRNALILHETTGIPIQNLVPAWSRLLARPSKSERTFKSTPAA